MGNCLISQNKRNRELKYLQKTIEEHVNENVTQIGKTASLQFHPNDNFTIIETKQSQTKSQKTSFKHINHLISSLQKQLRTNQQLYGKFLDVSILIEILEYFSKLYISHESAVEIIDIVLDFMTFCRNQIKDKDASQNPLLVSNFSGQYLSELSERWIKVRQAVYFFNKDHLKILNYICFSPQAQKKEYSHSFFDLKFDLSIDEAREVVTTVKKMCQIDVRSFCFLSNYLYKSCINLQRSQKMSITKIQAAYLDLLEYISSQNPPAPPIQAQDYQLNYHESIKYPQLIPKCSVDLTKYHTEEEKEFALEAFIMNKAAESMQEFDKFNLFIKEICIKNDGYRFKSGVKIKNKSQKKALIRIKQKMLGNIYNEGDLKKNLTSSIRDTYLKNFIDIYSYTKQEFCEFQQKMKKIFDKIKKPIQFKISDMLRGKCVFSSVQKINKCCTDIKNFIQSRQNEGFKLIQIDNRLRKENSDLVMKILFGNIIAQLQLVKDLNIANYEFSHKLYELQRSKFFTPLTQLAILNESISKDYFLQVKALILANSIKKGYDYKEKISYDDPLNNFKDFYHKLEIKINFFQTHPSEIDIKMMKNQEERFKKIIQTKLQHEKNKSKNYQQSFNNGVYFYQTKAYEKALKQLQSATSQFQRIHSNLLSKLQTGADIHHEGKTKLDIYAKIQTYCGRTYEQLGRYEQAHKKYEQQLNIKQTSKGKYHMTVAITLNNIGNVYQLQGNYPKALEYYQKCLFIKQKTTGNNHIGIATTLNNIGQVYRSQSNYVKALQYYEKCMTLQQKLKGKDCIQVATSLNNIGLAYKNQGQYAKALQYYQRCLYIKERVKGKDSIDIALTLNNIGNVHQLQGNYPQALEFYEKCLEIQQKVKGKDSVSIATTLNNIGLVCDAQNNYPKALEYFQKCLSINIKAKGQDNVDIAPTLNNIGQAYKNQGDYEKAIKKYQQAIKIYKKHDVKYRGLANSLSNLGYVYYKIKQYQMAINHFEESIQTYEKMKMNEEAKTCAQYIAKCYKGSTQTVKMREVVSKYQLKIWEI